MIRAIADRGSITAAAATLGYSQPALSQTIKRLEEKLGMPVLTRVARGVELTEAGEVLARHAATVLRAMDSAADELGDLAGLRSGLVRIAAFPSASSTLVPRLLGEMTKRLPGVRFSYLEAEPPEAVQAVRDHAADLALTFSYPGDPDDPHRASAAGLVTVPLWQDDMLLVVPDAPGLADGPIDLAGLADAGWIAGCPRCRGHLVELCAASGFAPALNYETDNNQAVIAMVAAGLGVALLPSLALATMALPAGVAIRRPSQADHRTVHLVTAQGSERVPAIGATISAIQALDAACWGLEAAAAS
ncbi:LysR family transcriptional regulator [Agreia sp. COWG]|uniref:LysR family transcriptional regulator n=1 Tax=Agreia sp. COWG TaxID=2773266 RepID=UPI001F31AB35|nr:LysR family transcriptional regulator [Agreia sp. COWG]